MTVMCGIKSMTMWLVSCSSALAALAYLFPAYVAEAIIVSFSIIFYLFLYTRLTVTLGILWGLQFYSIFLLDFYAIIWYRGYGIGRWYAIGFLVLYTAILSGVWFFLLEQCRISKRIGYLVIVWIFLTYCYFIFIKQYFFWVLGEWIGIPLIHPAIPLSTRSLWRYSMVLVGKNGAFIIMLTLASLIAFFMHSNIKNCAYVITFFLAISIFLPSKKTILPASMRTIGCVTPYGCTDPAEQAEKIMQSIITLKNNEPLIQYVIMPESIFPYPLNQISRYAAMWDIEGVEGIILGSHRKSGELLFNTLYHIKRGEIYNYYDKGNPLFFTERVPAILINYSWSRALFLKECMPFSASAIKNNIILDTQSFNPVICSELFFTQKPLPSDMISLCSMNDSWFYGNCIPNLMFLYAITRAIQDKSALIYCSYQHSFYIDATGTAYPLPTVR